MTNKELINNYLLLLKSSVEVYIHGTLESSNQESRKTLKSCLDDILENQANTFEKMKEYNWYEVSNVKASEIVKVLNKIQSN